MRKGKSIWSAVMLMGLALCSGGCIDGFRFGLQGGVESAVATIIETIIVDSLTPAPAAE